MTEVFAVLALVPETLAPDFTIVVGETAHQAIVAASKRHVELGQPNTQIIAVFTREHLAELDKKMAAHQP